MHADSHAEAPLNPGLVFEMLQANQRTAALKAAIELDIFRAVGQGPGDVASIARHCSASERGIRILCDFLVINGVLERERALPAHAHERGLSRPGLACLHGIHRPFIGPPELNESFEPSCRYRACRPHPPPRSRHRRARQSRLGFVRRKDGADDGSHGRPAGRGRARRHTGPMHVLDIAAGHGLFGIEIAKQNPQAHVTGLDWAPVLRVALENARKAGVARPLQHAAGQRLRGRFRRALRRGAADEFSPPL